MSIPLAPLPGLGIDWADVEHVFHLIDPDGKSTLGTVNQDPLQIRELVESWRLPFEPTLRAYV